MARSARSFHHWSNCRQLVLERRSCLPSLELELRSPAARCAGRGRLAAVRSQGGGGGIHGKSSVDVWQALATSLSSGEGGVGYYLVRDNTVDVRPRPCRRLWRPCVALDHPPCGDHGRRRTRQGQSEHHYAGVDGWKPPVSRASAAGVILGLDCASALTIYSHICLGHSNGQAQGSDAVGLKTEMESVTTCGV